MEKSIRLISKKNSYVIGKVQKKVCEVLGPDHLAGAWTASCVIPVLTYGTGMSTGKWGAWLYSV